MSEGRIGRAGVIIATGTLTSRLLGFFRAALLVYAIGNTGLAANAFSIGGKVPNFIYSLIITGALTAVLVPQITKAALKEDGGQAYINRLVTLAIVSTTALLPVIGVLTPWLIDFLGAEWSDEQLRLATLFAWWLLPQILFFSLYTVAGEVLNAKSFFGPYAWTPVLNNLISIAGMIVFIALYGSDADGVMSLERWDPLAIALLAGSSTLGVAIQGIALFAFWKKVGLTFRFDFRFRGIGLGTMGKVAFWMFLTVLIAQLVGLVYSRVQSLGNDPAVAGNMAWDLVKTIVILPHSIFVITLVTANFTRMSTSANEGNLDQMKTYLTKALRVAVFAMMFFVVVISLLSMPIMRLIQPTVAYATLVASTPLLVIMMCGMLGHSVLFVVNRGFFSMSDTKRPFFISSIFSVLALGGALISAQLREEWIVYGLAFFDGMLTFGQAIVTYAVLRTIVGSMGGLRFIGAIVQTGIAGFLAGILGFIILVLMGGLGEGGYPITSFGGAFVTCTFTTLPMAAVYLGVLWLMKNQETRELFGHAGAFIRRLLGR